MKIDIELVKRSLYRAKIDETEIVKIINDLIFTTNEIAKENEKEPTTKKQFVIVANDPYGEFAKLHDFTGWVVQIDDDANPATTLDKIRSCVCDFNLTPKGNRLPLKTFAEACEYLPTKITKEHKISIKTKTPVLIVKAGRLVALEEVENGTKE